MADKVAREVQTKLDQYKLKFDDLEAENIQLKVLFGIKW